MMENSESSLTARRADSIKQMKERETQLGSREPAKSETPPQLNPSRENGGRSGDRERGPREQVHVHVHYMSDESQEALCRMEERLEELVSEVCMLKEQVDIMTGEVARLTSEVTENTSVVQSAIALLNNLSDEIRNGIGDPAALSALADTLDANSNALAAAVTANTPTPATPSTDTTGGDTGTDTVGGDTGTDTLDSGAGADTVSGTDPLV